MAENGFHEITVQEIADHAGVAAGTVMLNFRTKRNILFILYKLFLTGLIEHTNIAILNYGPGSRKFDCTIDALIYFLCSHRLDCKVFSRSDPFLVLDIESLPFAELKILVMQYYKIITSHMKTPVRSSTHISDLEQHSFSLAVSMLVGIMRFISMVPCEQYSCSYTKAFVSHILQMQISSCVA